MKINKTSLMFARPMSVRDVKRIDTIILHHSASETATPQSIHNAHLHNGWAGAGYHLLVRKDGTIYKLRPIKNVGAHCEGHNQLSIGICFEGNFEKEKMTTAQIKAGKWCVKYYTKKYSIKHIHEHKHYMNTACAGKYFDKSIINVNLKYCRK